MTPKRTIHVAALARVEGEGALYLKIGPQGTVEEVRLDIFEPPRFFEAFLRGRRFHEAPDLTARVCGICPVAYQMSSARAIEKAFGVQVTPAIRQLRHLLYAGEWIQSHALHIYLLQAPDLTGHESALELAREAPQVVQRGLRLKQVGDRVLEILGRRAVHPINPTVGGFYAWPDPAALQALIPDLEWALEAAQATVRWAAELPLPDFEADYEFVALHHPDEYAILEGVIRSSVTGDLAEEDFEQGYIEEQVPHANALHSRTRQGNPYLVGPLARFNLNFAQLHPLARAAADEVGLRPVERNPYRALLARAVELVHACAVALEIARTWQPEGPSRVEITPRAGEGAAATEAPRGILYHRYTLDADGTITFARLVPPTAQNLARMEEDLRALAPHILDLPHEQATLACEHLIRAYDPCISCATHFLRLEVDRS